MLFVCPPPPKMLHKQNLQFLLGVKMAPRESNAYAKFGGNKQRALWYVTVLEWSLAFSRMTWLNVGFLFFFFLPEFLEAERARTAFESGTIGVRMRTSLRHNLHKIQEFTLF